MKTNKRASNLFLLLAAFLVLSAISIGAQNKIKQYSNEQALISLVNQMTNAQTNFDAATLDKIYAADYIEVSPIGEVDSREKAVGFYKSENNLNRDKTKMVVTAAEFSIRIYKDFAVVISRFTFAQTGNATPARPPVSFRATIVCRKEKNVWKIGSVQATGIRPSRPQPIK
jgi:ketosteroid isomerase-like protein